MALLFGTAGAPLSSRQPTTVAGLQRLRELDLDCLEVQFVQGVKMGEAAARAVREVAQRERIALSVHAPYAVNLNAHEPEKLTASQLRIIQSARIGALCGARSVVFHPGYYLGDPPEKVYERVRDALAKVAAQLRREGNPCLLRPELTGKPTQFGTIEELLRLSTEIEGVQPTLDFAHFHARCADCNSYAEFLALLRQVESRLGRAALEDIHIHISGIEYSAKSGERKHLVFREADFRYREFLQALRDLRVGGTVVCESPNLEEDARLLKETYLSL